MSKILSKSPAHSNAKDTNSMSVIGIVQIISAAICWGTLGIFSTYLSKLGFSGGQITILRVFTAGLLLLGLLPSVLSSLKLIQKRHWLLLSLQSLVGVLGMTVCFIFSVIYSGVAMAVALLYTAPVFSLIFAHFLLNEKMTKQSVLLSILAVIGVSLTMAGDKFSINMGVVIGLLAGVCYSMLGILGKKAMQDESFASISPKPSRLIFFTSVIISAVALLFVPQTYSTYATLVTLPIKTWGYVLGLSALGTIIPFFLYMSALERLPATRANVFTIIEPLTAIVLAVVMLGQSITFIQSVGVGLIILVALLNAVLAKQ